jgi:2-amino-4-hydroxy-6-hydroxymethyldihydropteridine diphosphokinase
VLEPRPEPPATSSIKRVYLSLGSNLGDRAANIQRALAEIGETGTKVVRVSPFYRTEPVDYRPQPWFVNCVAEVHTELPPLRLLSALQKIERRLGRRRLLLKGPRPIDLDILFYDNAVIRSAALTIPHERLAERRFVLVPLCDLAPDFRHPATRRTVAEMLNESPDRSQVVPMTEPGG